jgi:hypothetical protein
MIYSQAGQLLFGDGQSPIRYISSQGERDFQPAENQMGHRTLVAWHRQCYVVGESSQRATLCRKRRGQQAPPRLVGYETLAPAVPPVELGMTWISDGNQIRKI